MVLIKYNSNCFNKKDSSVEVTDLLCGDEIKLKADGNEMKVQSNL